MPYTVDSPNLPANVKKLPAKKKKQWVDIWNSAYKSCQEKKGKDCESTAFKEANGVIKKEKKPAI